MNLIEFFQSESYLVGVGADREAEGSCQTKIGQFEVAFAVN